MKPANYLDAHEKFLIGVATKGGVKTFSFFHDVHHYIKIEVLASLGLHFIWHTKLVCCNFYHVLMLRFQWSSYLMR